MGPWPLTLDYLPKMGKSAKLMARVGLYSWLKCPAMTPEQLLQKVRDRETFVAFVRALAAEREEAEKIEQDNPQAYMRVYHDLNHRSP